MSDSLGPEQRALVDDLVGRLRDVPGIAGLALGGSHARGRARPDSDVDLGLYYGDAAPLDVDALAGIVGGIRGSVDPVVVPPYAWGPWVNGGAWLTIGGQRVDLLYRRFEQLERVIGQAERGEYELHFGQQPPFGFFSATYLGELAIARILFDPSGRIEALQRRVAEYPEALRRRVVQDQLWSVEFALHAFARKFAARGEVFLTAGTLARAVHALLLVLFALNRRHVLNDKTLLEEVEELEIAPEAFRARVESVLANLGASPEALADSVAELSRLFVEVADLAGDLYTPKSALPGGGA